MSTQVEELARRFEETNQAAITTVERLDDAGMSTPCTAEQCTAAALAAHVGEAHPIIADWVRAAAAGEPLPTITMADIDRINAERAVANAQCSKETALTQLRANGAAAAAMLRTLRDEDLERSVPFALFGGAEVSVRTLIERVLIGNIEAHLPSLQAATQT